MCLIQHPIKQNLNLFQDLNKLIWALMAEVAKSVPLYQTWLNESSCDVNDKYNKHALHFSFKYKKTNEGVSQHTRPTLIQMVGSDWIHSEGL